MIIDKLNSRFLEIQNEIEYKFKIYNQKELKKHLNRMKRIINSSNFNEIEIIIKIKES